EISRNALISRYGAFESATLRNALKSLKKGFLNLARLPFRHAGLFCPNLGTFIRHAEAVCHAFHDLQGEKRDLIDHEQEAVAGQRKQTAVAAGDSIGAAGGVIDE